MQPGNPLTFSCLSSRISHESSVPNLCSVAQSCLTLCNPMDCSPPGSSVHGIFQARILEWVDISSSRGSSQFRDPIRVSCIAGVFFTAEPPRKPCSKPLNLCHSYPPHCRLLVLFCNLQTVYNSFWAVSLDFPCFYLQAHLQKHTDFNLFLSQSWREKVLPSF